MYLFANVKDVVLEQSKFVNWYDLLPSDFSSQGHPANIQLNYNAPGNAFITVGSQIWTVREWISMTYREIWVSKFGLDFKDVKLICLLRDINIKLFFQLRIVQYLRRRPQTEVQWKMSRWVLSHSNYHRYHIPTHLLSFWNLRTLQQLIKRNFTQTFVDYFWPFCLLIMDWSYSVFLTHQKYHSSPAAAENMIWSLLNSPDDRYSNIFSYVEPRNKSVEPRN